VVFLLAIQRYGGISWGALTSKLGFGPSFEYAYNCFAIDPVYHQKLSTTVMETPEVWAFQPRTVFFKLFT
jgi:hypothetical protein